LIIIERVKLLIYEKINILNTDLKDKYNIKKANTKASSAFLIDNLKEEDIQYKTLFSSSIRSSKEIWIKDNDSIERDSLPNKVRNRNSDAYVLSTINSEYNENDNKHEVTSINNFSVVSDIYAAKSPFIYKKFEYTNKNELDSKTIYKKFAKIFLKVKFENLHNKHNGNNIPQNIIWNEVTKNAVPKEKWPEFILEELKNADKYAKFYKKSQMDAIKEEI